MAAFVLEVWPVNFPTESSLTPVGSATGGVFAVIDDLIESVAALVAAVVCVCRGLRYVDRRRFAERRFIRLVLLSDARRPCCFRLSRTDK